MVRSLFIGKPGLTVKGRGLRKSFFFFLISEMEAKSMCKETSYLAFRAEDSKLVCSGSEVGVALCE